MTTLLVTGKSGQVGWELQSALKPLGWVIATDRVEMDLASPDGIRAAVRSSKPDIIVNAAAYTHVDKAEAETELAMRVNGEAPGVMAEEAKRAGALLIHYSTDYVFDGGRTEPYEEADAPNPVNAYGKSKLAGERAIAAVGCDHLILRTSWVYSARGSNFVKTMLKLAREREEIPVVNDQFGSPTWARSLAEGTARLLRHAAVREKSGIYHFSAAGHTSRFELAAVIVATARELSRGGESEKWARVKPIATAEYPLPAARPLHSVTSNARVNAVFGFELPPWKDQLRAFLSETMAGPSLSFSL